MPLDIKKTPFMYNNIISGDVKICHIFIYTARGLSANRFTDSDALFQVNGYTC